MIGDCVVDTSVGIKLFLVEDDSEAADRLFNRLAADRPVRYYVPDLFFVECANILWKYVRFYGYPAANATQDVADLGSLRLRIISSIDLISPALDMAIKHGITAYDACYVALAQQIGLPLITADATLVGEVENSGVDAILLADIEV